MKGRYFVNTRLFLFCSLFLMIVLGFTANNTYATNGYFSNGYSIESKALGGAGVALPQGSLDASINPAAMAFVGKRIDVGLSFFNPNREYKVNGNPSPPPAFGLNAGKSRKRIRMVCYSLCRLSTGNWMTRIQ